MTFTYQVQDFTATISTEEYIRKFSNSECFIKYCKECRNYGKVWVCPPFSHDTMAELRQYANLFLVATKIIPDEKKIPFSEVNRFFRPERLRIEKKLRDMEITYRGKAFAYAGSCLYCSEGTCFKAVFSLPVHKTTPRKSRKCSHSILPTHSLPSMSVPAHPATSASTKSATAPATTTSTTVSPAPDLQCKSEVVTISAHHADSHYYFAENLM